MDDWMTVDEIAQWLKVDPQTVRAWLRAGKLQGINFSGKTGWRVKRADLDAFLKERKDAEGKDAA